MYKELLDITKLNCTELVDEIVGQLAEDTTYVSEVMLNNGELARFVDQVVHLLHYDDVSQEVQLRKFLQTHDLIDWSVITIVHVFDRIKLGMFNAIQKNEVDSDISFAHTLLEIEDQLVPIRNLLVQLRVEMWENKIDIQRYAMQETSIPLIPVVDKISLMPLIGTIDTRRAKMIIETLLHGAVSQRSEVVLIDITAVPVIDAMVIQHILQAVEALRLVGTRCMLVGIQPEMAQTIVSLGVRIQDFETENTLQRGMEKALKSINRKIIEIE